MTRATTKIASTMFCEPTYGQAFDEDGFSYNVIRAYVVIAQMPALMTDHIDGRPRKGTEHWQFNQEFRTREAAERLIERASGQKLNFQHWEIIQQDFRNCSDMIQEDMCQAQREWQNG